MESRKLEYKPLFTTNKSNYCYEWNYLTDRVMSKKESLAIKSSHKMCLFELYELYYKLYIWKKERIDPFHVSYLLNKCASYSKMIPDGDTFKEWITLLRKSNKKSGGVSMKIENFKREESMILIDEIMELFLASMLDNIPFRLEVFLKSKNYLKNQSLYLKKDRQIRFVLNKFIMIASNTNNKVKHKHIVTCKTPDNLEDAEAIFKLCNL